MFEINKVRIKLNLGQKFSIWVSIEEFKQFGPGMYLLFLFLKHATIFTFFISLFAFIPLGLLLADGPLQASGTGFCIYF